MSKRYKELKRSLRLPIIWLGIGLGLLAFGVLPRKWMLKVCDFVSGIYYLFDSKGKRLARENLDIIFAEKPLSEVAKKKIIRRSYRNMSRTVGHAFWTSINARSRVEISGEMCEVGHKFLQANKPAVTVSGHIGCWEILSQLAFLEGHRMMSVAKKIGTDGMTKLLMASRTSIGQEIVSAAGAFKPLMNGLKEGKSLGLLVDQRVAPKKGGLWIRFFGRPIPVSSAPAFFSAKSKAPIVVAWSRPLKDGRYRCEVVKTYSADEARNIWGMTQRIAKDLEAVIRRHPSAWVLNYAYFREPITPEELKQLEERESK